MTAERDQRSRPARLTLFASLQAFSVGLLGLAVPSADLFEVPAAWWWALALLGALACLAHHAITRVGAPVRLVQRSLPMLCLGLLGYLYGHGETMRVLAQRLPLCADSAIREFRMTVLTEPSYQLLPNARHDGQAEPRRVARFHGRVALSSDPACDGLGMHRVRLSWYDPPPLQPGQAWQAEGRLRPPWGYRNPAGFDYERWLLAERLHGTGYVRGATLVAPGSGPPGGLAGWRAELAKRVTASGIRHEALVLALMLGDDSRITSEQWALLRDSGTLHLLVVSGLHVGLIAGLVFALGRLLLRPALLFFPRLERLGSRRLAVPLAMGISGAYVWLSGTGVPALRAWIMCGVVLMAMAGGRALSPLRVVCLVLTAVLIGDPLVVHQQGFWLSFGAVLSLVIFFEPRLPEQAEAGWIAGSGRRLAQFLKAQLVLFVAMAPLLASLQGSVPLTSPLVNALAVPLVSVAVLPLLLLIVPLFFVLPTLADTLLGVADTLLAMVLTTAETGAALRRQAVSVSGLLEWALLGTALCCLRAPRPLSSCLGLLALCWAVLQPDGRLPPPGHFRVTGLDVGQGSAILVDTHGHRLLYDTGPAYASGFDLGAAAVVPSFQAVSGRRLDALVLSHADLDHTGGAASVLAALAPTEIWASFEPDAVSPPHETPWSRCRAGVSWLWDGVRFRFLHPARKAPRKDNDRSCVLLIESSAGRALLAGDISAAMERRLPKSPVDLLFAPHHGSATSSSVGFVRGFQPRIVFISTDRRSRYGHPHPQVLSRYAGSRVFVTGWEGALRWESVSPSRVQRWRPDHRAYWHSG